MNDNKKNLIGLSEIVLKSYMNEQIKREKIDEIIKVVKEILMNTGPDSLKIYYELRRFSEGDDKEKIIETAREMLKNILIDQLELLLIRLVTTYNNHNDDDDNRIIFNDIKNNLLKNFENKKIDLLDISKVIDSFLVTSVFNYKLNDKKLKIMISNSEFENIIKENGYLSLEEKSREESLKELIIVSSIFNKHLEKFKESFFHHDGEEEKLIYFKPNMDIDYIEFDKDVLYNNDYINYLKILMKEAKREVRYLLEQEVKGLLGWSGKISSRDSLLLLLDLFSREKAEITAKTFLYLVNFIRKISEKEEYIEELIFAEVDKNIKDNKIIYEKNQTIKNLEVWIRHPNNLNF